ncbi:N-acetylmuramoyl-L-alanine amidase [Hymenobacter daecheongensis DSM 21074]|uniref:N-acetylmuramoyl-L-alanine amidase n=1 Tax=Hymenobacter daecheongensis DSM 21074 TaxID=1121955 RepID=A0A1M6IRV7_9BACT|nr:peptidoglycan recognition family protein [Hymenobacter daecheongensis]SHJ37184.1 N-acetylmuramoyl-L-alanine amidase [Hymenobacter daecheongensis DSM 21074]
MKLFPDQEYRIEAMYLTKGSKRRSGAALSPGVKFIVAHDTGNPGSTAANNVQYYQNTRDEISASAHLFVDDQRIIECVPALTTNLPEKAWHVRYVCAQDNELYGYHANDAAIGVEYCYGPNINADEAYRRYLWVLAYVCYRFGLDPAHSIVGHCFLDPSRKTDPVTGLAASRRSYEQLLLDVAKVYDDYTNPALPAVPGPAMPGAISFITTRTVTNIRQGEPFRRALARQVTGGTRLNPRQLVAGEQINGNNQWYELANAEYVWAGAVI